MVLYDSLQVAIVVPAVVMGPFAACNVSGLAVSDVKGAQKMLRPVVPSGVAKTSSRGGNVDP